MEKPTLKEKIIMKGCEVVGSSIGIILGLTVLTAHNVYELLKKYKVIKPKDRFVYSYKTKKTTKLK
jgi:hypothetical protein